MEGGGGERNTPFFSFQQRALLSSRARQGKAGQGKARVDAVTVVGYSSSRRDVEVHSVCNPHDRIGQHPAPSTPSTVQEGGGGGGGSGGNANETWGSAASSCKMGHGTTLANFRPGVET